MSSGLTLSACLLSPAPECQRVPGQEGIVLTGSWEGKLCTTQSDTAQNGTASGPGSEGISNAWTPLIPAPGGITEMPVETCDYVDNAQSLRMCR